MTLMLWQHQKSHLCSLCRWLFHSVSHRSTDEARRTGSSSKYGGQDILSCAFVTFVFRILLSIPLLTSSRTTTSLTVADGRYLARLRAGVDSAFGGGFLALSFLHDLDFAGTCPGPCTVQSRTVQTVQGLVARTFSSLSSLLDRSAERSRRSLGYTVLQMALAFFFLALFNVSSLEATRILLFAEFGLLLGRRRGPGLDKLRRFLKSVQAVERSEAFVLNVVKGFVLAVARQLITMGVVDWEILYLDGHFILHSFETLQESPTALSPGPDGRDLF